MRPFLEQFIGAWAIILTWNYLFPHDWYKTSTLPWRLFNLVVLMIITGICSYVFVHLKIGWN